MKILTTFIFTSLLLMTGCSQFQTTETERLPASGSPQIISTPRTIGFIFLGNTKSRENVSSAKYVLKDDLERDRLIDKDFTPIGDFMVRPGTVLRLTKNTYMYTKAADYISGLDKNSMVHLRAGTAVRILQYEYSSLTKTIAIVEVLN